MGAVLPALAQHGNVAIDEPVTEDASFALRFASTLKDRFTTRGEPEAAARG